MFGNLIFRGGATGFPIGFQGGAEPPLGDATANDRSHMHAMVKNEEEEDNSEVEPRAATIFSRRQSCYPQVKS